jgi:putative hydrolase of the HAD superfamily
MVTALERCREARLRTGCLTNNISGLDGGSASGRRGRGSCCCSTSSSVERGRRAKPGPEFYEIACRLLEVNTGRVFLDDGGVNLTARAMGMTTIKVEEPGVALAELERVLGLVLT